VEERGGMPEKPAQSRQNEADAGTTPKVAMAGSDHQRLKALRVEFSYQGLLRKIFGNQGRWVK